jgi:hypothetical protein
MPLAILAAANAAVSAIQQGCELYKEYKGTVLKAKKTLDEVRVISKEVTSVWSFLLGKLFPKKRPPPSIIEKKVEAAIADPSPPSGKKTKELPQELDELTIKIELINQLKVFFSCLTALKKKLADSEAQSLEAKNEEQLLSSAVDIEYAMSEIAKLQTTIRETMVYQSPKELGDLYTRVVDRVGIIQEQQELRRIEEHRKAVNERWLRDQLKDQIKVELTTVFLVVVFLAEIWAILINLKIHRW